jgi:uncharacterized protein VirK/YbjX
VAGLAVRRPRLIDSIAALRTALGHLPEQPLRKTWFFLTRYLLAPRTNAQWIRHAEMRTEQYGTPRIPRDLLYKPLRPFIRHGWGCAQRLDALVYHYEAMDRLFTQGLNVLLWRSGRVEIGVLTGRDQSYRLVLSRALVSRQEGELSIALEDVADGLRLAMITFTLVETGRDLGIAIGGLQGLPPGGDKRRIVTATRRLRGLRPKAAVLLATQAFARIVGARVIFAVCRATHVINEKAVSYRRRHFHTDYDAFWVERGGVPEPDFGFRLPLLPPHGKTASVTLIDDLVGACLGPWRRTSPRVGIAGNSQRAIRRLAPLNETSAANTNCRSEGMGDIPAAVLPWRAGTRSRLNVVATRPLFPPPSEPIQTDGVL